MARRIEVTGAGGVRLAAWEFGDPPKPIPDQPGAREGAGRVPGPAGSGRGTPPGAGAPGEGRPGDGSTRGALSGGSREADGFDADGFAAGGPEAGPHRGGAPRGGAHEGRGPESGGFEGRGREGGAHPGGALQDGGRERDAHPRGAPQAGDRTSASPASPASPASDSTPGVLLLHGLMGRASHWASTARWLSERHRAVALDQRGHGQSEKPPQAAYTREAYVEDAEAALEQLGLGPAVLIGHAMGALTGWQLAAKRPDLVRGLIVCDMRASALGAASQREWADWFRSWPVPFATLADVRKWFGEDDPWVERPNPARGAFYAEVMHESADGWRPVFEPEQMLKSRETWVYDAHWEELAQVQCPSLVVRGLDGELGRAEAQEMVRVLPRGQYAEVSDAGHLVHYDQPEAWRAAIEPFLEGAFAE